MSCPDAIKNLYETEMAKHPPNDFIKLQRRRADDPVDKNVSAYSELPREKCEALQQKWYQFHLRANHHEYKDFFSKVEYCRQLEKGQIDLETFLELIADRSFLFPEYANTYNPIGYPTLSSLVTSRNSQEGLIDEYSCGNEEKKQEGRKKIQRVMDEAFIPSRSHQWQYDDIMATNLEELTDAVKIRKEQMRRFSLSDLKPFSVPVRKGQMPVLVTELEKNLCRLFYAYAKACFEDNRTQRKWKNGIPSCENDNFPWLDAIHSVYSDLEKESSASPGYKAVVFFHLFTKDPQRLLDGKLKNYKFAFSEGERKRTIQDKIKLQREYKIELYDQILELFLSSIPEADKSRKHMEQDAKYLFLLYSGFEGFYHYDVSDLVRDNPVVPNIYFGRPVNYKDGVDYLKTLMRYHIKYCIPNHADQLLPALIVGNIPKWEFMAILSTFLLYESVHHIPTQRQVTHVVQKSLNTDQFKKILKNYELNRFNDSFLSKQLPIWCKELNIKIPWEEEFLHEGASDKKAVQICSHYVLEYALRSKLIEGAQENLRELAQDYIDGLLVSQNSSSR